MRAGAERLRGRAVQSLSRGQGAGGDAGAVQPHATRAVEIACLFGAASLYPFFGNAAADLVVEETSWQVAVAPLSARCSLMRWRDARGGD